MADDKEKWRLFEEQMSQLEESQKREPDRLWLGSIGCLIGGVIGPLVLVALIVLVSLLRPEESGDSPVAFLLLLLIFIPVGGIVGFILSPFAYRLIGRFRNRSNQAPIKTNDESGGLSLNSPLKRDIDVIIENFASSYPTVQIEQLTVTHPADDDGLWYFKNPDSPFEVQIESPYGMCPFLIETHESDERTDAYNVEEVMTNLVRLLHL